MLGFIFEGDIKRMGGGMYINRPVKRFLWDSRYDSVVLLNTKQYSCFLTIRRYGGFVVNSFKKEEDEKEVLDFLLSYLKENGLVANYCLRLLLKLMILFFMVLIFVYCALSFSLIALPPIKILMIIVSGFLSETFLYLLQGVVNRL